MANFFSKNEQALTQVLQAINPNDLKKILKNKNVAIVFEENCLSSENNKIILELATNLLSRLYPKIGIIYTGNKKDEIEFRNKLIELSKSINPKIEIIDNEIKFTVAICIGNPVCSAEKKIYIGADSWNLEVKIDSPIDLSINNSINPFSASAAACFGVNTVFRILFSDILKTKYRPENIKLSILNYSKQFTSNHELTEVNLNNITFVGLGAIGNAIIWSLKHLPNLKGNITFVDPEKIDLSNLQRYILTNQLSVNTVKVDLAKEYLSSQKELKINVYQDEFGEFVQKNKPKCDFEKIVVSVDNAETRIATQAVLPRIILNGWTSEQGYLGISRHQFDHPEKACLACMYIATSKKRSRTEEIAELIGFEQKRTSELVVKNIVLDEKLLNEIEINKGYPKHILSRFEGKTINEFYREGICGGVLLPFNQDNEKITDTIVPLAQQSVLTGILLAAELIKEELNYIPKDFLVEKRINILTNLPDYICMDRNKTKNPKCICNDIDYIKAYRSKFNNN